MKRRGTHAILQTLSTESHQLPNCARRYFGKSFGLLVISILLLLLMQYYMETNIPVKISQKRNVDDLHVSLDEELVHHQIPKQKEGKKYLVLWYTKITFLFRNRQARIKDFSPCAYNNCQIATRRSLYNVSDAVLFDGRYIGKVLFYKSNGQIWVFVAHESQWLVGQTIIHSKALTKRTDVKHKFNWTMTFDQSTADIWLPYGKIEKGNVPVERDFQAIAKNKTKGAIIITSHCKTKSNRMEVIHELTKHIDITVLGYCGTEWECGREFIHDNCFSTLNNTYAFYLAFENALCDYYFTENLLAKFNYDILFVTRGGAEGISSTYFPTGTVISSDTFPDVKHLGSYLTHLTSHKEEYAKLLEEKSKYYAVDYADIYQQALCDLCYRLNHQTQFNKVIPDITSLFRRNKSCTMPK